MELDPLNERYFKSLIELAPNSYKREEAKGWINDLSQFNSLFVTKAEAAPKHLHIFDFHSKDTVLFPGTFSPWHKGHEACVLGVRNKSVLILPDFNPWKEGRAADLWADLVAIIKFALSHPEKDIKIYPGFMNLLHPNPTVNWLPGLALDHKHLVMGDDTFLSIHRWQDANKLLGALDELSICPRMGREEELQKQASYLKVNYNIVINFLPPHDYQELSSTSLRSGAKP